MLIAATGWTWEYIDDYMTFSRLDAMSAGWRITPPLNVTMLQVAQALGVKRSQPPSPTSAEDQKLYEEVKEEDEFE